MDTQTPEQIRYHRQVLLKQIGPAGQERLGRARVLLVGCGALGCTMADQLARAGVGYLRITDRDIVEFSNLHRQVLFDEEDARQGLPKAVAAAGRLRRVNSLVVIEPQVVDVHAGNIEQLAASVDLILDGTDNVETRYLINDLAVRNDIPWVYGACVGTEGRVMLIRPTKTPCLRCIFPQPPRPGELATCDTAGVLGAAAAVVGAIQTTLAIQLLSSPSGADAPVGAPEPHQTTQGVPTGASAPLAPQMLAFDLWAARFHAVSLTDARRNDCACCGARNFEFLSASDPQRAVSLCGRDAVQLAAPTTPFDLPAVAGRLETVGKVERMPWLVRCELKDVQGTRLTVFADGRMIVHGTTDFGRARSIAARFVGT